MKLHLIELNSSSHTAHIAYWRGRGEPMEHHFFENLTLSSAQRLAKIANQLADQRGWSSVLLNTGWFVVPTTGASQE